MVEYVGQGHEKQVRTCPRVYVIGRAGGKDDKAAHNSHEGVQQDDADSFPCQPFFLADVAAEDGQGSDAQTQGEEGLAHGGEDYFIDSVFSQAAEVWLQEVGQAAFPAWEHDGMDCQGDH